MGRPEGNKPRFVENLDRIDATRFLAKTRGSRVGVVDGERVPVHSVESVRFECRDNAARFQGTLTVEVTWTGQHFGGSRGWWLCPHCRRRCGVLLMADLPSPVACRRCWGAVYLSDYPGRLRWRRFVKLARGVLIGSIAWEREQELQRELRSLTARRRRGVRRGRRLFQRALRMALQVGQESRAMGLALEHYARRCQGR